MSALERFGRYVVRVMAAVRAAVVDLRVHWRFRGGEFPALTRRVLEQWRLLTARGITASDYYHFRLYRSELSREDKLRFLGTFEQWRWQRQVDPVEYDAVTEDKIVCGRYLSSLGIPVPPLLAIAGDEQICPGETVLDSETALATWLSETPETALFLKPSRGITGAAALAISRSTADPTLWETLPAGRPLTAADVARRVYEETHWLPFVIQKRLRPHPSLARLSPDVFHTVRLITMLSERFVPIAASLKIGSGVSPVDNLLRGNLIASLDMETGALRQGWTVKDGLTIDCPRHPVSGVAIRDIVIPDWHRALGLVERCHRHLFFDGLLGWDIGFSPEGPIVVETNTVFNPILTQIAEDRGLLQAELAEYFDRQRLYPYCGLGM